jgi:hypothetical protein
MSGTLARLTQSGGSTRNEGSAARMRAGAMMGG